MAIRSTAVGVFQEWRMQLHSELDAVNEQMTDLGRVLQLAKTCFEGRARLEFEQLVNRELEQIFLDTDRTPIVPLLDFFTNLVQCLPQPQELLQARPYIKGWQAYEANTLFQELYAAKETLSKQSLNSLWLTLFPFLDNEEQKAFLKQELTMFIANGGTPLALGKTPVLDKLECYGNYLEEFMGITAELDAFIKSGQLLQDFGEIPSVKAFLESTESLTFMSPLEKIGILSTKIQEEMQSLIDGVIWEILEVQRAMESSLDVGDRAIHSLNILQSLHTLSAVSLTYARSKIRDQILEQSINVVLDGLQQMISSPFLSVDEKQRIAESQQQLVEALKQRVEGRVGYQAMLELRPEEVQLTEFQEALAGIIIGFQCFVGELQQGVGTATEIWEGVRTLQQSLQHLAKVDTAEELEGKGTVAQEAKQLDALLQKVAQVIQEGKELSEEDRQQLVTTLQETLKRLEQQMQPDSGYASTRGLMELVDKVNHLFNGMNLA
ncbi:MAG: hypothetical protein FJZ63_02020 [Chlamydiae bacterium]|nr:hypothetical protein [Chlamydiota bacterium]